MLDYCWPSERLEGDFESRFSDFEPFLPFPLATRREKYQEGDDTGNHRHLDFYALYAVRGGSGLHVINGRSYGLARGDVYLLPPGAIHGYRDWENLELDAFYFQIETLRDEEIAALRGLSRFWRLFLAEGAPHHRLHLSPENWRPIETQISELRAEIARNSPESVLLARNGFFRLLVALARDSAGEIAPDAPGRADFAAVLRFCEENFARPLPVRLLAAQIFLSPGHFSELFARETGQSPAAYLRRLRLEKARVLLLESDLSVAQTAWQAGFKNAAHFSRSFRAFHGVSPRAFRLQGSR